MSKDASLGPADILAMSKNARLGPQAQPTVLGALHDGDTDHLIGKQPPTVSRSNSPIFCLWNCRLFKCVCTLVNHRIYFFIVLASALLCILLLRLVNVLAQTGNQPHSSIDKNLNKTSLKDMFQDFVQQIEEHTVSLVS